MQRNDGLCRAVENPQVTIALEFGVRIASEADIVVDSGVVIIVVDAQTRSLFDSDIEFLGADRRHDGNLALAAAASHSEWRGGRGRVVVVGLRRWKQRRVFNRRTDVLER